MELVPRAEKFLSENANAFTNEATPLSTDQSVASSGRSYSLDTIPLGEELINSSEFLLVGDQPILMYSRFNTLAPVVTRVNARVLLRVAERARTWIRVEIPGGVPGWVKTDQLQIDKDFVEINQDKTVARTDPSETTPNNDIGLLKLGTRLVLLEQQEKWARVLLPENIPTWIEDKGVKKVEADAAEISKVWQAQRVRLKVSALSSRAVKIAANSGQVGTVSTYSGGEQQQIGLSDLPTDGISLPPGETGFSLSDQTFQKDGNGFLGPNLRIVTSGVVGAGRYERTSTTRVEKVSERPTAEPPKSATTNSNIAGTTGKDETKLADTTPNTIQLTRRNGVKVRAGASTANPAVTSLPANTLVDVVGRRNGFARVTIPGGLPVWIPKSDGRVLGEENVLVENDRVRIFSLSPTNNKARILGLFAAGSVLRLIDQNDHGFHVIAPEEITGWISLEELKKATNVVSFNRVWREQSNSLLTGYLEAELQELAVVPKLGDSQLSGTGVFNDNRWLFQETSKDFTLQLFSIRNHSSALSQLRSLNGRGQLFSTNVKGQAWYFVLFGKFLTKKSAELAAKQLPNWASEWRVRSVRRLQVSRCKKIAQLNDQESLDLEDLCR